MIPMRAQLPIQQPPDLSKGPPLSTARAVGQAAPTTTPPPLQKIEYVAHLLEEVGDQVAFMNNMGEEYWVLCAIADGTAWFARPKRAGSAPAAPAAPAQAEPTADFGPEKE